MPALNPIDDARDRLRAAGVSLYGVYLGDPYGLLSGGLKRGGTYSGRLDVEADFDATKLFGLPGATLHANLFRIHGEDLSATRIGNFLSINDIGALPSTRLYEAWYEQRFGERLSLRLGQQGHRRRVPDERLRRQLHQRQLRLARPALRRPARRRPRLSALHPGGAR